MKNLKKNKKLTEDHTRRAKSESTQQHHTICFSYYRRESIRFSAMARRRKKEEKRKAAVWAQPAEPSNAYRRFNVVFGCRPLYRRAGPPVRPSIYVERSFKRQEGKCYSRKKKKLKHRLVCLYILLKPRARPILYI
jgi:hypothetical protein